MSLISLITLQGQNKKKSNYNQTNSQIAKAVSNNISNFQKINDLSTYTTPDSVRYNSNFGDINFYMSPEEIIEKSNLLKDAEQNGKIYTLDTEMFGVVPNKLSLKGVDSEIAGQIIKANENGRMMTELSIVQGGKEIFNMSNTANKNDMERLLNLVTENKGTSDLGFIIDRSAGLADAFPYKNLKGPQTYSENADMLSEDLLLKGIRETAENSEYKISEPENFKAGAQKLLDKLLEIADEKHSVIQTMNGQNFDMDVIFDHLQRAGITVTDEQKNKILKSHVDTQRLILNTKAKDSILKGIKNRYDYYLEQAKAAKINGDLEKYSDYMEKASSLQYNHTNTSTYEAAQGIAGKTFEREDGGTHNAKYDSITTEIGTKAFYNDIYETADEIENGVLNSTPRNGYFIANNNLILDKDKDIFFSNSFDSITNTYNQVAAEEGHLYKARMYSLPEDFSFNGLSAEESTDVRNAIENGNLKYVLELEDQYNYISDSMIPDNADTSTARGVRKSYIITDNKDILQNYINDGKLSFKEAEEGLIEKAYETTRESIVKKAIKEKENWIRPDRKGYSSFSNALEAYEQWNEYVNKNNYSGTIEDFLNTASMEDINKYMPSLTNKNGNLITERASKFKEMLPDLEENYDYYKILKDKIDSSIENIQSISKEYNVNKKDAEKISNSIKTKILNESKYAIDNKMTEAAIQSMSKDDLIKLVYENYSTPYISSIVNEEASNLMKENPKLKFKNAYDIALKKTFRENFGVKFDRNLQIVKDSVLGYKLSRPTMNNINKLDILINDETFTLGISTRKNIEQSLNIMFNMQRNSINDKNKSRTKYVQNNILDSIFENLDDRGLILDDDLAAYNRFKNITAPQAKIQLLTDSIWNVKKKAESIALKYSNNKNSETALVNVDINSIKDEDEYNILSDYLSNIHLTNSKELSDGVERINGKSKAELIKNLSEDVIDSVINTAKKNEKDSIYSFGKIENETIQKTKQALMNELGYTENHANILIDKILNNPENSLFERYTRNGQKEKIGISNVIKIIDDKGYLFTVTNDNLSKLENDLLQGISGTGIDLDEIKKYATVFNLNKVENRNGVNVIKQNSTSFKALTKDIVKDVNGVYQIQDTYDQVLLKLSSRYKYALEQMSLGNYDRANKTLSSVNRGIMEEKSLSAPVIVPNLTGEGFIKEQRMTMSDYMLGDKFNIAGLMDSIPAILEDPKYNNLKEEFKEFVDGDALETFKRYIEEKTPYAEYDNGVKTWLAANSKSIATAILEKNDIKDQSLINMLNTMKESGSAMFLTKESGEAIKGFVDTISVNRMVAGSHASKASRPLINQILNAPPIKESEFDHHYQNIMGKSFFNEDGSNALGIIFGRSFVTKEFTDKEAINITKGIHHGMSVKTKFMTSTEYGNRIEEISKMTANDSEIAKLLTKYKTKSFEDIKDMAKRITSVSSLYEDSSLLSPVLARLLGQRGVTTEILDKTESLQSPKYKLGNSFKGKEIIGYDEERNGLILQSFRKYHDSKIFIGYSEKSEGHTLANLTKEEIPFAQDVFEMMFGGAQYVVNPNIKKHESFNSMIQFYTNAITNNISNENELNLVNQTFAKYMPWQKEMVKKINGRYSLVEDIKTGSGNIPQGFNEAINEIKQMDIGNIASDIARIERDHIGMMDIALAQDNTIEKRAVETVSDVLGGVKINYRSQQIMGMFIGDGGAEELIKYRRNKLGRTENLLSNVINAQIEEMVKNKRFTSAMEQSANINTALIAYYSDLINGSKAHTKINDTLAIYKNNLNKSRIIPMSLDDAIGAGGLMSADILPDIFKREHIGPDGVKIAANAYKIDISHLQLDNPIYKEIMYGKNRNGEVSDAVKNLIKIDNPSTEDLEQFLKINGIKEKIDTLYVPAMDAAALRGEDGIQYNLLNIQKYYADLLNNLDDLNNHRYENKSYSAIKAEANENIGKVFEGLMSELTDKNGYFKKNLQVRLKESARLKVANISAPIGVDTSKIIEKSLNKTDNTMRSVAFVNEMTLFGDNVKTVSNSYKKIAKDLLKGNIDDTQEFVTFFNNYYKQNAKNITDIKNIFNTAMKEGFSNDDYISFGKKYLEEIGINGLIMRDPAMLTSSAQAGKIFVNNDVTLGSVWTDFVTAKYINGDGDGDEIGLIFNGLLKRKKGYSLKNRNSAEMKDIEQSMQATGTQYYRKYVDAVAKHIEKENENKATWTLSGYLNDYNSKYQSVNGVVDYIYDQELQNLSARYLKGAIGQVSNPNYFIKSGKTIYFQDKPMTEKNLRMSRNIGYFTDITEQSLIDAKSVTNKEQSKKLNTIARKYRESVDRIMDLEKPNNRLSGLEELLRTVSPILNEDDNIKFVNTELQGMLDSGKELDNSIIHELAKNIINGNYDRGNKNFTSIEEIFGDLMKVTGDAEINKMMWSEMIRQTNLTNISGGKLSLLERMERASVAFTQNSNNIARPKLFESIYSRQYNQITPIIDNVLLSVGDNLISNDLDNPDMFEVTKIARENGKSILSLENSNGEIKNITGNNFEDITAKMGSFSYISEQTEKAKSELIKDLEKKYSKGITNSFQINEKVFRPISEEDTSFKSNIFRNMQNTYNKERSEDLLFKTKVLQKEGYLTENEAVKLQRQMNEHIKNTGSAQNYNEALYQNLSKLDKFKKRGVNNAYQAEKFSEKLFNKYDINTLKTDEQIELLSQYNNLNLSDARQIFEEQIDNILKEKNIQAEDLKISMLNSIIDELSIKNKQSSYEMSKIYNSNSKNTDFLLRALNINDDIINSTDVEVLKKVKIGYGSYAGLSIEELNHQMIDEILSPGYLSETDYKINKNLINATNNILNNVKTVNAEGIINKDSINITREKLAKQNNFIEEIQAEMNEAIKSKGLKAEKSNKNFFRKATNALSDSFSNMSKGQKTALGIAAAATTAIGAIALYSAGNRKIAPSDDDKYKAKDTQSSLIKSRENGNNYSNIPISNSSYYRNQNVGVGMNIAAKAPSGSSGKEMQELVQNAMGGNDINLNTTYTDETNQPTNDEIDNMINDSI